MSKSVRFLKAWFTKHFSSKKGKGAPYNNQSKRKKYEGIIAIETEDGVKLVDCSRLPKGFLYWLNQ